MCSIYRSEIWAVGRKAWRLDRRVFTRLISALHANVRPTCPRRLKLALSSSDTHIPSNSSRKHSRSGTVPDRGRAVSPFLPRTSVAYGSERTEGLRPRWVLPVRPGCCLVVVSRHTYSRRLLWRASTLESGKLLSAERSASSSSELPLQSRVLKRGSPGCKVGIGSLLDLNQIPVRVVVERPGTEGRRRPERFQRVIPGQTLGEQSRRVGAFGRAADAKEGDEPGVELLLRNGRYRTQTILMNGIVV